MTFSEKSVINVVQPKSRVLRRAGVRAVVFHASDAVVLAAVTHMISPLSHNELIILDRQMTTLTYQLSEIATLLESRLGDTNEMAISARSIQQNFASLARKIHNQAAQAAASQAKASKSQTA